MASRRSYLDANIILRYLTDEPRELADRAARILEALEDQGIRPVVAALTLGEVVFVLESVYGWKRHRVAAELLAIVSASVIEFLEQKTITQALRWYREFGTVHFADAYIAAAASERKSPVISFDRGLRRLPNVKVIDAPEHL